MNLNEALTKIESIDMTVPAAISFSCACVAVMIHSWPLVIISLIIDILVSFVASTKVISWLRSQLHTQAIAQI